MNSSSVLETVEKLASQVAEREGVLLYDVELVGAASGRTLRVYIDRKDATVGVDDCANVSRGLSLLLDVEDPIPGGAYELEVSSPGMDRKLRKPWHFEQAVGKKVEWRLLSPLGSLGFKGATMQSAKKFEAKIASVDVTAMTVQIEVLNEVVSIPMSEIERAKLTFDFDEHKGKKKKFNQN